MSELLSQMADFQIVRENSARELTISQKKHRRYVESHNAVLARINNVACQMYQTLYDFVRNNKDLYDEWFMYNGCFDYRGIQSVKDRPLKKAWAVQIIQSDGEGEISRPTYLIPYLLLEDPEAYRRQRLVELSDIAANKKRSQRANKVQQIKDLQANLEEMDQADG